MKTIGIIGWRGMVGSVLLERMQAEGDFRGIEPVFFSTSNAGGAPPEIAGISAPPLQSAYDIEALRKLDVIVSCQGGDYTAEVHPALRRAGWDGYWIDAASTLRMNDDAVIVLDPVNREIIDKALARGVRDLVGGNCTVSLMLMVMAGPIREGWVEWISSMTYQAASGAGARAMTELVAQMCAIADKAHPKLSQAANALEVDREVTEALLSPSFPKAELSVPLAASLIPWIDKPVELGQTREEKKGFDETNKLLGLDPPLPVDGICVRVSAMRCHSQALTVKLKKDVPLDEIEACIRESHRWAKLVPNAMEATKAELSPAAMTGSLDVAIGRLRKMRMGPEYLAAFTVGDQLLWGAAEPLRRALGILRERAS